MDARVDRSRDGVGVAHAREVESPSSITLSVGITGDDMVCEMNHMGWYRFRERIANSRYIVLCWVF